MTNITHLSAAYLKLMKVAKEMSHAILLTESGSSRNQLTEININIAKVIDDCEIFMRTSGYAYLIEKGKKHIESDAIQTAEDMFYSEWPLGSSETVVKDKVIKLMEKYHAQFDFLVGKIPESNLKAYSAEHVVDKYFPRTIKSTRATMIEMVKAYSDQFKRLGYYFENDSSIEFDHKNILEHGRAILYERSEEKERQYGPMQECIDLTAKIASAMGVTIIDSLDVYNVLIALKLAREAHAHKEDNMLDAVVYIGAKNDYLNKLGL